jgi:hypothetical protein
MSVIARHSTGSVSNMGKDAAIQSFSFCRTTKSKKTVIKIIVEKGSLKAYS